MKLIVQGKDYEFDENRLTVAEARIIKKYAGLGIAELSDGLEKGDPDAICAFIFLAKKRAGEACRWHDLDDLDLANDIDFEGGEEQEDEDGEPTAVSPKSEPQSDDGTTPTTGTSSTSESSPTASTSDPRTSTDSLSASLITS